VLDNPIPLVIMPAINEAAATLMRKLVDNLSEDYKKRTLTHSHKTLKNTASYKEWRRGRETHFRPYNML